MLIWNILLKHNIQSKTITIFYVHNVPRNFYVNNTTEFRKKNEYELFSNEHAVVNLELDKC